MARWTSKNGGVIPPDVFITVAERSGQMRALTQLIVEKSLNDMRDYLQHNSSHTLSINVSTVEISDATFHHFLNKEISKNGLRREQIILEITERSTTDLSSLHNSISQLRDLGYRIAIDDFGTGNYNINYLIHLKFDILKVDKLFTKGIGAEKNTQNMLEKILEMGEKSGVEIIIEGVETLEQEAFLRNLNPKYICQGWLYGKPTDIVTLLNVQ